MTITKSFLSYGSLVQILTENIIPDSSRNYNIVIKKGMKINRGTREEFTDTISAKKRWEDAENDKRK